MSRGMYKGQGTYFIGEDGKGGRDRFLRRCPLGSGDGGRGGVGGECGTKDFSKKTNRKKKTLSKKKKHTQRFLIVAWKDGL